MKVWLSFGFELDTSRPEEDDPEDEPGTSGEVASQTYEVASETEGLYVNRFGFAPARKES